MEGSNLNCIRHFAGRTSHMYYQFEGLGTVVPMPQLILNLLELSNEFDSWCLLRILKRIGIKFMHGDRRLNEIS